MFYFYIALIITLVVIIIILFRIIIQRETFNYRETELNYLYQKRSELEGKIAVAEQEYPGNAQISAPHKKELQAVNNLLDRLTKVEHA